jgi:predicted N-acetyltransferase YhbS
MSWEAEYLADGSIDAARDAEIRGLLTTCFTGEEDAVFRRQRYAKEPYPHRWVVRDERGAIVAHTGVHEKHVEAGGRRYRIGGIAEVCVHPDCRGRGFVKRMLAAAHDYLAREGFDFAVLFGNPEVYRSSGYARKMNVRHDCEDPDAAGERERVTVMVRELSGVPWPDGEVYMPGPTF